MPRKKLSEMTRLERVDKALEGASWEEAEEAGIEILARCMALHFYSRNDGEKYFPDLIRRICIRRDQWAKDHTHILALAAIGHKHEMEMKEKKQED